LSSRLCRCLGFWCAVSVLWALGVVAFVARRIADNVAASEDLARDIAALDGVQAGGAPVTRWEDVFALLLEHRAPLLLTVTLLPPLVFLAAMLTFVLWRGSTARPAAPAYSAAVRRPAASPRAM